MRNKHFTVSTLSACCLLLPGIFSEACTPGSHEPDTLFSQVPTNASGLDFRNDIRENDTIRILTFEYLYNGGGVGVGDFNGDGLQDLFFAGNQNSSRLYLNKGDLRFEDVTEAAGVSTTAWCTGVAVADFNQDGRPDIYVSTIFPARTGSAANLLFLNKGGEKGVPTFKEVAAEAGLDDRGYSTQASLLDYDHDGDLDVYLLTNALEDFNRNVARLPAKDGTGKSTDRLYRNEGPDASGVPHFTNVSREAGILQEGWGLGICIADFNDDGWEDIYCANDFLSNDLLWINNQNGTFTNRIADYLSHQSHNSMGCDVADINNDGYPEVVTLDMMPFTNPRIKSMFGMPDYDRYQLGIRQGYQPQFVRNMLQLNQGPDAQGQRTFSEIGQMAGIFGTDWSWSALFADFDNDGWKDLFITNGYVRDITDLDFTSYNAELAMFGDVASQKNALSKALNELPGVHFSNFIYRNKGDLTFEDKTKDWGIEAPSYSNGAIYADLDNDGDLDLVTNDLNHEARLFRNNLYHQQQPKETHYLRVGLNGLPGNRAGYGATLTAKYRGKKQVVHLTCQRGYKSSVEPVAHFGLGQVAMVDTLEIKWPDGKVQHAFQVKADGQIYLSYQPDSLQPQPVQQNPTLFLSQKAPEWKQEEKPYVDFNAHRLWRRMYSQAGPALATGDLNGDGWQDLVAGGGAGQPIAIFFQDQNGNLSSQPQLIEKEGEVTAVALFDADGDGDLDLYAANGSSEFEEGSPRLQDQLFINQGKGVFVENKSALPEMKTASGCVAVADYDHDGDLDLFVGSNISTLKYPGALRSYLLRNDSQTGKALFRDATPDFLQMPGMVTTAIWLDLQSDGFPELMLAGEYMPLTLADNQKGKLSLAAVPVFQNSEGWWNTLATGDFDGDGDLDILAGNYGLNSRYQPSPGQPVCLYAKDFDQNGQIDPMLSYYVQGKEVCAHTRDALTMQIPALKKRFNTYAAYGKLSFEELLPRNDRKDVLVKPCKETRSMLIENLGKGQFALRPLPMIFQMAPINAFQVADFNGDGRLDVLAGGNLFCTDTQTGQLDASHGWVMLGDGKGSFSQMPVLLSGFGIRGEVHSLVCLDGKGGEKRYFVGSANEPLKAFLWNKSSHNKAMVAFGK